MRLKATQVLSVTALLAVLLDPARAPGEPPKPRSFDITASRFQFEPARLEVSEGDAVRLTLHSTDTTHGFGIKELTVEAVIPKGGEPVTVEFVADQAGTFEFFCTEYCGPRHREMRGTLVVTPRSAPPSPTPSPAQSAGDARRSASDAASPASRPRTPACSPVVVPSPARAAGD
ncbi:MAG TPA: cupredoxin domain-containing protein [Vicinamibacteria bacterium]|jgi:cytochrome c oxidase subunit 2|nr:cupredoxin domain-containing protein [Vicinamibacteria bacterium]